MDFKVCMKRHLRRVVCDESKVNSLVKIADARLKAIRQIKKDEETASIIVEGYYEIIKELLVALLLKHGFKSENHECLISFFKNNYPDYEYEVTIIHNLKNIRNRINYDGLFVKPHYLEDNELEFIHIISTIKDKIHA